LKLISDVEFEGPFRCSAAREGRYDQALNDEEVRVGNQVNNYNARAPRWAVSTLYPD
jgi:hypothetical protein